LYDHGNKKDDQPILGAFVTIKPLRHFLLACLALGWASLAQADIIVAPTFDPSNQVAPPDTTDYEGSFFDGTAAPYDINIGTFNFSIPVGNRVVGATISGTFGDVNIPTSAVADLFVDAGNINVGGCDSTSDPCFAGTSDGSLVSWSHTFSGAELSELASDFASGSLDFTAVQNSFGVLVVGTPSLDIQTVPEPSSIFILTGGLLAFAALRRRK
jgi:hypothetical protein